MAPPCFFGRGSPGCKIFPDNTYKDISELPRHLFDEMSHFFSVYKTLEGKETVACFFGRGSPGCKIFPGGSGPSLLEGILPQPAGEDRLRSREKSDHSGAAAKLRP